MEVRVRLAADVEIAADGFSEEVRDALPEAVGVELRRVAPEHAVVFGDDVHAAVRLQHALHFGEHFLRVRHGLREMAADGEIERFVFEGQRERIRSPEGCSGKLLPRFFQVRLLEIDAGQGRLGKELGESFRDLAGAAADVEDMLRRRSAVSFEDGPLLD